MDGKRDVFFPLFKNKDAIIYYKNTEGQVNFYYANRETKEISQVNECAHSDDDKESFEGFKASFDDMENNSSRRSSDGEHQLIERVFKRKLHRDGIQYEQDGIRYRDSRTSFPLVNAYRKYIRQAKEVGKADKYWCEGAGQAQRLVIWLLQRICEEGRPFIPLPANLDNFKREIDSPKSDQVVDVLSADKLVDTLGKTFAFFKGYQQRAKVMSHPGGGFWIFVQNELPTICRLIETGKANVIELQVMPDTSLGQNSTIVNGP